MINGFTSEDAIKATLNWANEEGNEDFDTSFVESLSDGLQQFGRLSERQEASLSNIISKFHININVHLD